jgi:E3 ubiquitin-protein ligase RNF5/185
LLLIFVFRSKVPPRPTPTRTEQPDNNRFSWGNNDGNAAGFHMSFGIGAFPFGFFASAFNFGQPGAGLAGANVVNGQEVEQYEFLSKIFLYVAVVFIVWLLLA